MKGLVNPKFTTRPWFAYVAAVILVIAATLLRVALQPLTGPSVPFVTFFAVAVLLAWLYGIRPAAFSVAISVYAGTHYILGESNGIYLPYATASASVVGFAVAAISVSYLLSALSQALGRARAAEEEQRRTNDELKRINRDLEAFAFAASHDMREPLRTVRTYSELLVEVTRAGRPHEADVAVQFIAEGTERINHLLDDLLAYTQLSADSKDQPETRIDLNSVVEATLRNLDAIVRQSGATVTHQLLPVVTGREAHFTQLFQNLIENAIKYAGDEAPKIRISAGRTGSEWRVAVADNGIGIPASYREHIFELFKRLHGRHIPGTGIGLAICRKIVEARGGRIWVESEGGQGSTFYFTIPIADDEVPVIQRQPAGVLERPKPSRAL